MTVISKANPIIIKKTLRVKLAADQSTNKESLDRLLALSLELDLQERGRCKLSMQRVRKSKPEHLVFDQKCSTAQVC